MKSEYLDFIASKRGSKAAIKPIDYGQINSVLFPFQRECCMRALELGRAAMFADTGLGKTLMQCEWARHISGDVLIVAPLAVAQQTIREAAKYLGMEINYSKTGEVVGKYTITNYERLDLFDHSRFAAVVLDESSILKGQTSKTREYLCAVFADTPYKLACTATPAPNDYTELGNHSDFLGVMKQQEMLMRWFVHDSANTADWRLKGHAVKSFWEWVASWAICVSKPSDIGYPNDGYDLPPLRVTTHKVETDTVTAFDQGLLFDITEVSATNLHAKKRQSVHDRVAVVADMVNRSAEPWIVWCESNQESELLSKAIPDAVEVKGSHTAEHKEKSLMEFTDGIKRVIVSKPSICGHGMNWQHCRNMVFASISYSHEQFYQAVRRSWRFGQTKPVNVHVVIADAEIPVWRAIELKSMDHVAMKEHMRWAVWKNATDHNAVPYNPQHAGKLPDWLIPS
jgi:hypothetical protein